MKAFIEKFKQTKYYKDIVNIEEEIVLIYVGGSRCFGTDHEYSDYDITIITDGGIFRSAHQECFLRYNGKKVHWYYCPIEWFSHLYYEDIYNYIGALVPKYLDESTIIYKNPKYDNYLSKLKETSNKLSSNISRNLFKVEQKYIQKVLNKTEDLEDCPSKVLYYLVLASYEITNEQLDVDFLRRLSLGAHNIPLTHAEKIKAVERLKLGQQHIVTDTVATQEKETYE
jgi:predicted nucleotidyltransferase